MVSFDGRIRLASRPRGADARPIEAVASELAGGLDGVPVLEGAAGLLGDERSRHSLVAALAGRLPATGRLLFEARDAGLRLRLTVSRDECGRPVLDAEGAEADLSHLYHPLASLFPVVGDDHCMVATRAVAGARFEYLDEDLIGPDLGGRSRRAGLREHLARVIDPDAADPALARRYVEPGIGRTYLVDFLRLAGRPEMRDFSVTGVGLTPFSRDGFFFRGPHVDGHMPAIRARHRHRLAELLADAGCRVPAVAAIVAAPGLTHTMPDHTRQPAALMVRGFRFVLRVKQLDPLANVLMSAGAWQPVQQLLEDGAWIADGRLRGRAPPLAPSDDGAIARPCTCLIPSFFLASRPGRRCDEVTACRRQRLAVMRAYAPRVLELAFARLSEELGRDPEREGVSGAEYAAWFAETMGRQLAIMRRERFLHDYRAAQTQWDDPYDLLNSLTDTNVTLLAELADLDTGVLVDRGEFDWLEQLRISHSELAALRERFDEYHANEVRLARGVVETVAFVADGGEAGRAEAARTFMRAYEQERDRRHAVFAGAWELAS